MLLRKQLHLSFSPGVEPALDFTFALQQCGINSLTYVCICLFKSLEQRAGARSFAHFECPAIVAFVRMLPVQTHQQFEIEIVVMLCPFEIRETKLRVDYSRAIRLDDCNGGLNRGLRGGEISTIIFSNGDLLECERFSLVITSSALDR